MKQQLTIALFLAIVAVCIMPGLAFAATDTLVVYASGPSIDKVIGGDTLANGTRAHHVYKFVSTDTTYLFDATITKVSGGTLVKVFSWYDNEWGFSNRMLDVAVAMMQAK